MNIGYCLTGSFCTFKRSIDVVEDLVKAGYNVTPIMSENAYNTDTRFGKAEDIQNQLISITGNSIIHSIVSAEPIGPRKMFDALVVAPCTGNTLAKLSLGITDTTVTMAVKSHIRNSRPVVIGISTNDALGGSAKNIGALLNYKNYYFVPFGMDDSEKKPKSMVCDFSLIPKTLLLALDNTEVDRKVF